MTIEFRTHLPAGTHIVRIMNAVPGPNPEDRRSRSQRYPTLLRPDSRVPWQIKFTDDDGKPIVPFLLVDWVEWEGPLARVVADPAYKRVFFGGESAPGTRPMPAEILARSSRGPCAARCGPRSWIASWRSSR